MSTASAKKPVLKGLHFATIGRNITGMAISVTLAGVLYYTLVNRPKKKRYAEYYKNFDPEKLADRMRQAGLLQSVGPDEPPKSKKK